MTLEVQKEEPIGTLVHCVWLMCSNRKYNLIRAMLHYTVLLFYLWLNATIWLWHLHSLSFIYARIISCHQVQYHTLDHIIMFSFLYVIFCILSHLCHNLRHKMYFWNKWSLSDYQHFLIINKLTHRKPGVSFHYVIVVCCHCSEHVNGMLNSMSTVTF